jgi:hypothetical protein
MRSSRRTRVREQGTKHTFTARSNDVQEILKCSTRPQTQPQPIPCPRTHDPKLNRNLYHAQELTLMQLTVQEHEASA